MLATQSDVFDVSPEEQTILTVHETGATIRTLCFSNLKSAALTLSVEESEDGVAWAVVVPHFTVGVVGSETSTVVHIIDSPYMLSVHASGGNDDQELSLSYIRVKATQEGTWS